MSFAYLPWYTGDYFRDTRGLSMAGHGCYLLLLAFCWDSQGPLPFDAEEVATICGARSQEERSTMDRILGRYFTRMDDGWYNERLQREIERCENISRARSTAGRMGYDARAKQLPSKSQANAKQMHLSPSPSLSPPPSPKNVKRLRQVASLLPSDWELPDDWKNWASTAYRLEPQRVVRISLAFKDHWLSTTKNPTKRDWLATWRKWVRTAVERGEQVNA